MIFYKWFAFTDVCTQCAPSLLIRKFIIFSFTTILFVFHDFFLPAYESKIFVVSFVKISRMLL